MGRRKGGAIERSGLKMGRGRKGGAMGGVVWRWGG